MNEIFMPQLRVGQGWDTHALVTGRPLILGGVLIEHTHGLMGHSDADALCHAIIDALLGATALGDIGQHFPDTDAQWRGANSITLLTEVARRIRKQGWQIGNIDSTIVAQAPKLALHLNAMRQCLAQALALQVGQINIKAKTAEKMGPVGRGESIETQAVCLLFALPR
jgi:2-C-methyl-D-erythritol 2,4-cyclodiphosphate synthase